MDSLSPEGAAPTLEDRLGQEHKLETLGALAGFIAHDLNNELTVILGNVELSLDSLDPDDRLYEGLVEARNATHRCVEMTRALLNLGRSVKPELKPVELDSLLRGTERILRKVLPAALPTKFAKHTHLPVVMADANQIQQVIMNLAANASRAMSDESLLEVQAKNGPKYVTISISLSRIGPLLENPKRLYTPLSPGNANREPSTFGLGRDVDIVRAHGGLIDMARDTNSVTFRMSLPALRQAEAKVRPAEVTEGTGCVLIADDEGPVRRAA